MLGRRQFFLKVKKGASSNKLQFSVFPSPPRTAAACAERIYGSTEIQLSNVN
jgi:hypothetical protein